MRFYIVSANQVFVLILVVFTSLFSVACLYDMGLLKRKQLFHDTILTQDIVISADWLEIDVMDKVVIERDRQFIGLVLEPPYETPYNSFGVKVPSGEIITPEILLIDDQGKKYVFLPSGAAGTKTLRYSYQGKLPKDRLYTKVLLQSKLPINARQVLWSTYSAQDLK